MFLHCSSDHCSFAAFIFFLTSLFSFLYSSPASVLVYFCCFSRRLWSHRSRTSFESPFSVFHGALQLLRIVLLLDFLQACLHRCQGRTDSLEHFYYFRVFELRLMRSLVTSIFLFACEAWTLTAELQRRIQAMEMRCYRKILRISYKDHATNEEVRAKIQQAIGPQEDLTIVKRRKL